METRYQPLAKLFIENNYDEIFEYCDTLIKTNPEDTLLEELRWFSSLFKKDFDISYLDIQENFKILNIDLSILDNWLVENKNLEDSLSFKLFYISALSNSNDNNKFNVVDGVLQRLCIEYPRQYEPQFVLGTIYVNVSTSIKGDSKEFYNKEAIKCFNKGLELEPGHIPSLVLLCSCYIDVDNYKALQIIEKGILIYPDNPTINFVKASILFKTWSYKDSKNILTKIIEISPCAYEAKELAPHLIELINSKTKTKNTFYKIIEKGIIVLGLINVLYAFTSIFAEPYKSEIPKHYYDSIRVIHTGGAIPIVLFILGALISLGLAIVYSRMLNTKVKSEISLIFNLVLGLPCLLLSIYMPFIFLFSLARDFSLEKTSENFALELLIGIIVGPLLLYLFWYLFTFELPWNKKRKKSR